MITVVYYPEIYPSVTWLKTAALVWAEVHTIRPQKAPMIPEELGVVDAALGGVLRPLPVGKLVGGVSAQTLDSFWEWVRTRPVASSGKDEEWFGLFTAKVELRLLERLYGAGLARSDTYTTTERMPKWMRHVRFGGEAIHIPPRTPELQEYERLKGLASAELNPRNSARLERAAEDFLDSHSVDVRRKHNHVAVRDFRERTRATRMKFHEDVQGLVARFRKQSSERQLNRLQKEMVEYAREEIAVADEAYRRAKIATVLKTLTVAATRPGIASMLASMLGVGLFAPAAITAALALFGAQQLLALKNAKDKRRSSVWSYAMDVRDTL